MKLGILKTDDVRPEWLEQFGEYPDMFVRLLGEVDPSMDFIVYDVQRDQYPESINEVDAYLMTGSKSSVYEDKPWIHQLSEFVQRLNSERKKLVGICFGHQMIASALGGKTEKSEKGWGIGVHAVQMRDKTQSYSCAEDSFRLLVSHQDQVVVPAKGAKVLAGSDFCPIAMCQVDDHILTFQGHPEFVPEYSRNLLHFRRNNYTDELFQQALTSLGDGIDQQLIAKWIVDFLNK